MSGTAGQGFGWDDQDLVLPSLGTDGCVHILHISWVATYWPEVVVLTAGAQRGVTKIGTDSSPVLEHYFNHGKSTIQKSTKTRQEYAT